MTATAQTQALAAEWRDFFALTKPRVMSLVVFTGLCGLLAAPGHIHPVLGFTAVLCISARRGRGGRAQPVVGSRHRRADEAHRQAAASRRAHAGQGCARFRRGAVGCLGADHGPRRALAARG